MARVHSSGPAEQTLTFRIGAERFAVPAAIVREVAPLPKVIRVPHAPESLIGIGNFRGAVLPIVSFARLADRKAETEQRVILLDTANPMALAVDEVTALRRDGEEQVGKVDIEVLAARDFAGTAKHKARAVAREIESVADEADNRVPLVVFAVAGQEYALAIAAVQEVLTLPNAIARLPQADAVVVGSIAVRDALLPLLSLKALLALPGATEAGRASVVVVRIGSHQVGLVVDEMRAIVRAAPSEIDTVPAVLVRGSAEARIQAICRLDGGRRLVSVLAVEHLLREDLTQRLLRGAEEIMAEQKAAVEASEQFLAFRIGDEEFGLPIGSVVEVAQLPEKLTRLPKAPPFVQGVMNLRGQVVPVIDQARRFRGAAAEGERRRVIVVRLGELRAGFVVESVSEVLRVPLAALRPAPELGDEARVFDRVANLEETGRMVLIVSPKELLDRAERELLANLGKKRPASTS